jgi:hypothetical protein
MPIRSTAYQRIPMKPAIVIFTLALILFGHTLHAETTTAQTDRHLREVQTLSVPALKLKIRAENQPPWETSFNQDSGRPTLIVQSPYYYHPSTVMTYQSYPEMTVASSELPFIAETAIRTGSKHFGLSEGHARALSIVPAQYGAIKGYESTFMGKAQGDQVQVKIFVGQGDHQFPVALTVYTQPSKLPLLKEVIRRNWTNLEYQN